MSIFKLTSLKDEELETKGIKYTLREVMQQPKLWIKSFNLLKDKLNDIRDFIENKVLSEKNNSRVILSGAGSSHFIGLCCEDLLRIMWNVDVESKACTEIVTSFESFFLNHLNTTMIYFSRSGESPEILGAFLLSDKILRRINHIIVTCNKHGRLVSLKSRSESKGEKNVLRIVLPEDANDKGLAMTSSFTTMLMFAQFLAYLWELEEYERIIRDASVAAEKMLKECSSLIEEIAELDFKRAFFLGTGPLYGCAAESHLKLQELTAGRVICKFDSYLGIRHGPEVAIDDETIVVYFVSSNPFVRRYETDLMEDLHSKGLGLKRIAVCCGADEYIERYTNYIIDIDSVIPDYCRPIVDVIFGQLLGLFKSLNMGLKPDWPSEKDIITRVVKGVKIYDYCAYKDLKQFKIIV